MPCASKPQARVFPCLWLKEHRMSSDSKAPTDTSSGKDKDLGFDPDSPDVNDPATDPPHPPPIDNPAKDKAREK